MHNVAAPSSAEAKIQIDVSQTLTSSEMKTAASPQLKPNFVIVKATTPDFS